MFETFSPGIEPGDGTQRRDDPEILTANFGDGYEQRTGNGINALDRHTWSVAWPNLPEAEGDAIFTWLKARSVTTPFWWTPPGEISRALYTCHRLARRYLGGEFSDISAEFRRAFDLIV